MQHLLQHVAVQIHPSLCTNSGATHFLGREVQSITDQGETFYWTQPSAAHHAAIALMVCCALADLQLVVQVTQS